MSGEKLSRRTLLAGTATALGACGSNAIASVGQVTSAQTSQVEKSADARWTNWSGRVTCMPQTFVSPASSKQLIGLIQRAHANGQNVRIVASGHSFVPLCCSRGMMISLDRMSGIESVDFSSRVATILAGTKIYELGEPLRKAGLAMENMGDIDRQGIAGAISTGTHGTGRGIGSMSTQVVALRMVSASGEVVDCSTEQNPELLKASQVSLGTLGVITHVRLRLLPAYRLHEKTWEAPLDECLENLDRLMAVNRHFEFFWWPQQGTCSMKSLHPTLQAPNDLPDRPGERIGHSHEIFPSQRDRKFNEIEFAIPEASGLDCFQEIRQLMRQKYREIQWPIEYRTLAADDIYLSPAYGRDTITISLHQGNTLPYAAFFADVEAIFRNHQGRPHWGKIHTHTAAELNQLYPMWDKFHEIRRRLDAKGRFMNEYLHRIFL